MQNAECKIAPDREKWGEKSPPRQINNTVGIRIAVSVDKKYTRHISVAGVVLYKSFYCHPP